MARAKKDDDAELIVNAREPSFGVGIFVGNVGARRLYKFADGEERSFKEAYCELYGARATETRGATARRSIARSSRALI